MTEPTKGIIKAHTAQPLTRSDDEGAALRIEARHEIYPLKRKISGIKGGLVFDFVEEPVTDEQYQRLQPKKPPPDHSHLTPQEIKDLAQAEADRAIQLAAERDGSSLEDLFPDRVKTAYRLVREMARYRSMIDPHEMLSSIMATEDCLDPWTQPQPLRQHVTEMKNVDREAMMLMLHAESLDVVPPTYGYEFWELNRAEFVHLPGLALLPPRIPRAWRDETGQPRQDYNPRQDPAFITYMNILGRLVLSLHIYTGSAEDREQGRRGLLGLLDPDQCRLVFPAREHILIWEELLVRETIDLVIEGGNRRARAILHQRYGLMGHEITALLAQAMTLSRSETFGDIEDARSMMILRLEDMVRRCRQEMDRRGELAALKQLGTVQGLGEKKPEDEMADLLRVIGKVAKEPLKVANDAPPLLQ